MSVVLQHCKCLIGLVPRILSPAEYLARDRCDARQTSRRGQRARSRCGGSFTILLMMRTPRISQHVSCEYDHMFGGLQMFLDQRGEDFDESTTLSNLVLVP